MRAMTFSFGLVLSLALLANNAAASNNNGNNSNTATTSTAAAIPESAFTKIDATTNAFVLDNAEMFCSPADQKLINGKVQPGLNAKLSFNATPEQRIAANLSAPREVRVNGATGTLRFTIRTKNGVDQRLDQVSFNVGAEIVSRTGESMGAAPAMALKSVVRLESGADEWTFEVVEPFDKDGSAMQERIRRIDVNGATVMFIKATYADGIVTFSTAKPTAVMMAKAN
jgi:hypothetical protein